MPRIPDQRILNLSALKIRRMMLESVDAPEGIEFWRWLWVPVVESCVCWPKPVAHSFIDDGALPPSHAFDEFWRIERRAQFHVKLADFRVPAWVGWEREAGLAILFFARGGPPLPDVEKYPDDATNSVMRALADEGMVLRLAELAERLSLLLDRLTWEE